jgi:octanoyl-[GcvH]:protein N-octanoyltransferase
MSKKIVHPFPIKDAFMVFDSKTMPYTQTAMSHFALTDALIQYAGFKKQPLLHFWRTKPLVILGMMDTKLPHFHNALSLFEKENVAYVVRNSGGLAVVSDPGVLNLSLIFPEEEQRLSINDAYKRMHSLIEVAFSSFKKSIDAIEIPDSYCPGDYDLSIDGKKFAGISQRRIKGGIAIMIYLSVNGDQTQRAQMIRSFYEQGLQGKETKWHFPNVRPEVMTTLEEAFDEPLSVNEVKQRIQAALTSTSFPLKKGDYTDAINHQYMLGLEKMKKRNKQVLKDAYQEKELKL